MKRSATCGELRAECVGKTVILNGWVHRKREHGEIVFFNLRDRYGITQVVVDADASADLKKRAGELRFEYCIAVEGLVRARPDSMKNPDMATGDVELVAQKIEVLSTSEVLPFQIDEKTQAGEDLRLTYRYLDLRSASMQRHLQMRSTASFAAREYLMQHGFMEIETPTFVKSTPEGARDFLVPSRIHPGEFYALPQSPQLYKQILMVGGCDKYFQIARCYRDEDARGDRQPEFTQIDIEMSFVSREDVIQLTEGLMQQMFKKTLNYDLPKNFPMLTYDEAMARYGSDKPDIRFDMELQDASFMAELGTFGVFKDVQAAGGAIKALCVKGVAKDYSRKKIEALEAHAKIYHVKGLAWMKVGEESLEGGISKFFAEKETNKEEICAKLGAEAGDLLLFVADPDTTRACTALGAVRTKLGKDLSLYNNDDFKFLWIVDFPLFEWNEDEEKWDAMHHMFSSPREECLEYLESDPAKVRGDLYDLVLNGYEVASGSIRIHDSALQNRIFNIVGFDTAEAEKKFGFLTTAFKYGPPPHGGIAPGLDRLIMIMAGESSIKEVIAFPKNTLAASPMDGCPSPVEAAQMRDLHLTHIQDDSKTSSKDEG